MGLGDHGEAKRVRHALPVRLAVAREREHRLEQRLDLESGLHLAREPDGRVACVPELVGRAGLDGDGVAGAGQDGLAPRLQGENALDDLDALALRGVHVCGGDRAARPDLDLEHDGLAGGVGGGAEERHALARRRVLDRVSCVDHGRSPSLGRPPGRQWIALGEA
jgi:hypothetical protein